MKNKKIVTTIIIILIAIIIAVGGLSIYYFLDTAQTNSNRDIENEDQLNKLINTNQSTVNNSTTNKQLQNQAVIDPIIKLPDNEMQQNESIVSTYYYSQLDEIAKQIYDGLKTNKDNLISGNYVIDYDTKFNTLLNTEGGELKLNQAFQSAWDAFSYDNMDLFYIDITKVTLTNEYYSLGGIKTYKISIGPGENSNYFQTIFKDKKQVESAKAYLENIKKQMIEQTVADDAYTKIAKVHNWLIYFINYENNETSKEQHTIYGALKNGKAVCEGYARAFKYLMDGVGVPCVLVSGEGKNSQGQIESHAWNYVQINDKWYAIDVTWDDPVVIGGGEQTKEMKYKYFLKGSEEFFENHTENGKFSESSITFKFPTLDTENYKK